MKDFVHGEQLSFYFSGFSSERGRAVEMDDKGIQDREVTFYKFFTFSWFLHILVFLFTTFDCSGQ